MRFLQKRRGLFAFRASLQTKVFLTFLVLLLIVLCCFLAYVNWLVIKPLKERNENEKLLTAANISNQLDEYINSQNQLSHRILSNRRIFDTLSAGYKSTYTIEGLKQSRELKAMMFEAIGPSMNIRDMTIYNLDGKAIASYIGLLSDAPSVEAYMNEYSDAMSMLQSSYMLSKQPSGKTIFTRAIINQNGQTFGYLTIELDKSYLQMPTRDIATGDIYIIDQDKQVISSSSGAKTGSEQPKLMTASDENSGMYMDHSRNYIAYRTSLSTGWTTYVVTPRQDVLGPVNSVKYLSILLFTALMLFSFAYIYLSSKNLLLPIRKLRSQISRIQYGNLNIKVDNRAHNNELIALNESFQELLDRLQQSIEREKLALHEEVKARNSALQAQIAPHFIHNVLYLISIAAQEGKNNAVSDMCKHLSDSLRYIVSSPYEHVTLEEELEHTRHYLSLVQHNYEDDLEWEIIADESAKLIQLPRLVIQPFVENCIEHAFDNADPPWRIQIRVKLYNGVWAIEISDNGEGIAADKIKEIMDNIDNSDERTHELHLHKSGFGNMGVVNTVNRLKLMYKNRLFFNIYNNTDEWRGTTIQIIGSLTKDFY
ncbi:two-component system sensor histidine kinase YesM [Paenibacillus harenae]|nr:two-component system sensor histidine kinase YesM [Paenibacillus harenae]